MLTVSTVLWTATGELLRGGGEPLVLLGEGLFWEKLLSVASSLLPGWTFSGLRLGEEERWSRVEEAPPGEVELLEGAVFIEVGVKGDAPKRPLLILRRVRERLFWNQVWKIYYKIYYKKSKD